MHINIKGPVYGQSGFELLTRGIVIALDKLGVIVHLNPKLKWNFERCLLDIEDLTRLNRMTRQKAVPGSFYMLHQYPSGNDSTNPLITRANKKVCYTLFETDRCPKPWIAPLNKMDEVWVFSEFNQVCWTKSGVKNVKVMPFGIDTDLFSPKAKPIEVKNRKGFAFITNGDFTERKNFDGLVSAFVEEFTDKEDVCLIMKVHYKGFVKKYQRACVARLGDIVKNTGVKNPPMILFFGDKVPTYEIPRFYTAGDCFVLPTRGEGLGLPFMEALACGVPVIATNCGGQLEFLNESNSYLIDYAPKLVDSIEYIEKCPIVLNHYWAEPDLRHLRGLMRHVYQNREEAKQKALVGREQLKEKTWQKVALWIIKQITEVKRESPVCPPTHIGGLHPYQYARKLFRG